MTPYYEFDAIYPERFTALKGLHVQPGHADKFVEKFAPSAQIISNVIEADSPEDAVAKLNAQNMVPLRLVQREKEGLEQLMRLKKKRAALIGEPKPLSEPIIMKAKRRINYFNIIGVVGMLVLLILALLAKR